MVMILKVENVLVRPLGDARISISWTSESPELLSWIFINGVFAIGPFMPETTNRSVTLTVPPDKTFVVEVHDFRDIEVVPAPIEEKPQIKPQIAWNSIDTAAAYRIYHTIFDIGSIESLLLQTPSMGIDRMEIDCPITLEGRNGRWHSFRVETVDQFGNESHNNIVAHFAVDLPLTPELSISRDVETGSLTFRIL